MSRVAKNIIYNVLGQSFILILSFLSIKYIYKNLGGDALGIIYFIMFLNSFLIGMIGSAINTIVVKEMACFYPNDFSYIEKLIQTGSFFYGATYIFCSCALFISAPFIVKHWIHLNKLSTKETIYIVQILGMASFVSMFSIFYSKLFEGMQYMGINNLIEVSTMALQQLGILFILWKGGVLLEIVYWMMGIYILRTLIYMGVYSHFFSLKLLCPRFSQISWEIIHKNKNFFCSIFFISATGVLYTQMDKLVISKLLALSLFGYYSVVHSTISKGIVIGGAISGAVFPSFSQLFQLKNKEELLKQYHKMQDLTCFSLVLIFGGILFFFQPIFSYLFTPSIANFLFFPAFLISLGLYMQVTLLIPYALSLAVERPDIAVWQHFYDLFFLPPLAVFLIYFFQLTGAGILIILMFAFRYIYFIQRVCKEILQINPLKWYFHIFKISSLILCTYGITWGLFILLEKKSLFTLAEFYLFASFAFLFLSYFLIGKDLKKTVKRYGKLLHS